MAATSPPPAGRHRDGCSSRHEPFAAAADGPPTGEGGCAQHLGCAGRRYLERRLVDRRHRRYRRDQPTFRRPGGAPVYGCARAARRLGGHADPADPHRAEQPRGRLAVRVQRVHWTPAALKRRHGRRSQEAFTPKRGPASRPAPSTADRVDSLSARRLLPRPPKTGLDSTTRSTQRTRRTWPKFAQGLRRQPWPTPSLGYRGRTRCVSPDRGTASTASSFKGDMTEVRGLSAKLTGAATFWRDQRDAAFRRRGARDGHGCATRGLRRPPRGAGRAST